MKEKDYFGNLLNEKDSPYSLKYFRENAIIQPNQKGIYRLYILEESYAVAKCIGKTITDYCLIGSIFEYREIYSNSQNTPELIRQALYHGACILEGVGLGYRL